GGAAGRIARRVDPGLAAGRRRRLHAGHVLLPPRVDPLFARDLAPVRDRRQRVPLRGGQRAGADAAPARGLTPGCAGRPFARPARALPILAPWIIRPPLRPACSACDAGVPPAPSASSWARSAWRSC